MGEQQLSIKAREALKHIREWLMRYSKMPSTRELMHVMDYKSPRSITLLMEELNDQGFIERKDDGSFRLLKDLKAGETARTVPIPLVGSVTCGFPMLAEENIEAMISVSTFFLKKGHKYFLLRAQGDSMDKAGIQDGDLVLIMQQRTAENGQKIIALIDDEATVKEFQKKGNVIALIPRSSNPKHKPIILNRDFQIQGVVAMTIPFRDI